MTASSSFNLGNRHPWITTTFLLLPAVISFVSGFVNIPAMRKPMLSQSTFTSTITNQQASVVQTEKFHRNPFAQIELGYNEDNAVATTNDWENPNEVSGAALPQMANIPGTWWSQIASSFVDPMPSNIMIRAELIRRKIQKKTRVSLHNFLRDSGLLRAIMDFAVTIGTPALAWDQPEIIVSFFQLTLDCIHIPYGDHPRQFIEMYLPAAGKESRGLVFFVHGGAWGSGLPWQYRMVSQPFLQQGMAVAVVSYRTFPDGDMNDQVDDLEKAANELTKRYPGLTLEGNHSDLGVCVIGHSSGGHIAMQMLVNQLLGQQPAPTSTTHNNYKDRATVSNHCMMRIDSFIGMSAPYEIASHYEFERRRGLEELSPMKAACGYDKKRLSDYSPVLNLFQNMVTQSREEQQRIQGACPRIAMIHGVQDDTVPFTSSQQAAYLLALAGIQNCDTIFLSEKGHSDTVVELMLGGKTQDTVMDWLLTKQSSSM